MQSVMQSRSIKAILLLSLVLCLGMASSPRADNLQDNGYNNASSAIRTAEGKSSHYRGFPGGVQSQLQSVYERLRWRCTVQQPKYGELQRLPPINSNQSKLRGNDLHSPEEMRRRQFIPFDLRPQKLMGDKVALSLSHRTLANDDHFKSEGSWPGALAAYFVPSKCKQLCFTAKKAHPFGKPREQPIWNA